VPGGRSTNPRTPAPILKPITTTDLRPRLTPIRVVRRLNADLFLLVDRALVDVANEQAVDLDRCRSCTGSRLWAAGTGSNRAL